MPYPAASCPEPASTAGSSPMVARAGSVRPITESVVAAACQIAERLERGAHRGRDPLRPHRDGALEPARSHPDSRAGVMRLSTVRSMSLLWGVVSEPMPNVTALPSCANSSLQWGRARGLIAPGARIVLIRGSNPADPTHNELEVYEVP